MAGRSEGTLIVVTAYVFSSVQDAAQRQRIARNVFGKAVTDGGGADEARRKPDVV
jgi:hypothetical protein